MCPRSSKSRTVNGMWLRCSMSAVVSTATYAPGFQCTGTCSRQECHQWWQETVRSTTSGAGWARPAIAGLDVMWRACV